jgi:hypothetical protein
MITQAEGKNMIQACLNAPDREETQTPPLLSRVGSNYSPENSPSRPASALSFAEQRISTPFSDNQRMGTPYGDSQRISTPFADTQRMGTPYSDQRISTPFVDPQRIGTPYADGSHNLYDQPRVSTPFENDALLAPSFHPLGSFAPQQQQYESNEAYGNTYAGQQYPYRPSSAGMTGMGVQQPMHSISGMQASIVRSQSPAGMPVRALHQDQNYDQSQPEENNAQDDILDEVKLEKKRKGDDDDDEYDDSKEE